MHVVDSEACLMHFSYLSMSTINTTNIPHTHTLNLLLGNVIRLGVWWACGGHVQGTILANTMQ